MDGIKICNVRTIEDEQIYDDSSLGSDSNDSLGSSLVIDEDNGEDIEEDIEEVSATPSPQPTPVTTEKKKVYPKPPLSYSVLAALAFKNCFYGNVPVSAVYSFIMKHFPYFINASTGWKNSIRHNLSMNKCFKRLDPYDVADPNPKPRKGMLWTLNPARIPQTESMIVRSIDMHRDRVLAAMRYPGDLDFILRGRDHEGQAKFYDSLDSDDEAEAKEDEPEASNEPEKPFVFTEFKDGALPLITLYSKNPGIHTRYSAIYPVVT